MKITHGMSDTPTYVSWRAMKQRCLYKKQQGYPRYGGRGITIPDSWMYFPNFLKDMGVRPPGTSIERRDGNKPYSKENCYWATPMQQQQNTSHNVNLTHNGKTLCVAEWSRITGIGFTTIFYRLAHGYPMERVLSNGTFYRKPTHCPSGHEYSKENTGFRPNGHRVCKICCKIRQRIIRDERKARGLTSNGTIPKGVQP